MDESLTDKHRRHRVYLFLTRSNGDSPQVLVFDETSSDGQVQTPGGTVEPGEEPSAAALREAWEETGLTEFGTPRLLAEDDHENQDERLRRYFYHLPVLGSTPDAWDHWSREEGVEGGVTFRLRWIDLPEAPGLHPHFRTYLDRLNLE